MGEKLRIAVEFTGIANGTPVTVTGKGHLGQGRLDLELHADVVPLGFDPALLALGALDPVLLVAVRPGDSGDPAFPEDPLHVHLSWQLLDENYRRMGGFEVASSIRADAGRFLVRGQFVKAQMHMEPVERVVSVAAMGSGSVVPLGADGLVLTTTSGFTTDFGNAYLAVAVTHIVRVGEWELGEGLDVREVTVERAAGRERDYRAMVGVAY